ncbi:MAG: hypothetical protein JXQ87_00725 [Bacteroidia bacterium]
MNNKPISKRRFLSVVTVVFFGVTALYHLFGALFHDSDLFNRISQMRHLLFFGIDTVFILIYFLANKWFKWLLVLFAAQQITSHIFQLIEKYEAGEKDYISILVLIFLPTLIYWHFKYSSKLETH